MEKVTVSKFSMHLPSPWPIFHRSQQHSSTTWCNSQDRFPAILLLFYPWCSPMAWRSYISLWETFKVGCACPAIRHFISDLQKCWVFTVLAGISWSTRNTAVLKIRLYRSWWEDTETKMPEVKGLCWIHLALQGLLCANAGSDVRDQIKSANWLKCEVIPYHW